MPAISWTCPFCHTKAVLRDDDMNGATASRETRKYGMVQVTTIFRECPNLECNEVEIVDGVKSVARTPGQAKLADRTLPVRPESRTKPWPSYIPAPLLADYAEACQIELLSPKASAALARRCLQGMIRDFWGITQPRLADEIDALQAKVDAPTWEAIDSLRKSGNVGAHMEQDTGLIGDVDPDEGRVLIQLIETLFTDWYVGRHDRAQRMQKIKATADARPAGVSPAPASPAASAGLATAGVSPAPAAAATPAVSPTPAVNPTPASAGTPTFNPISNTGTYKSSDFGTATVPLRPLKLTPVPPVPSKKK